MANSQTVGGAAAGPTYGCALLATHKAQVMVEMLPAAGNAQAGVARLAECAVALTQSTITHTTQHTPISNTLPMAGLAAFGPQAC